MLKFSAANAKTEALAFIAEIYDYLANRPKLGRVGKVYSLDLLSGYSCPFAKDCLSKAVVLDTGKRVIQDGPDTVFRCFSASAEVQYKNTFASRKYNFDLLRGCSTAGKMAELINSSLPKNLGVCRIHVAGDFFNQRYFDAWLQVAKHNPDRLFYAYTKNLPAWLRRRHIVDRLENFVLTASYGGKKDELITKENLRFAKVIADMEICEAILKSGDHDVVPMLGTEWDGLAIDHDDSHAALPSKSGESFALLLHSTQPAGSDAGKIVKALKGVGSYSRKKGGAK